jgi:ribosomal protein S18 acetylase RimI-like enzyme
VTVSIRTLEPADAAALKPFRLQSLRDQPDAFHSTAEEWNIPVDRYQELISENPTFTAFAPDGRMVGLAILGITARPRIQTRHKCEIWSVYVDPAVRGQGIARSLMGACIAEARRLGFEAVVLTASTHLTHVVKLYESLGFTIYGTERGMVKLTDGRYIDDHLMELWLDQPSRPS